MIDRLKDSVYGLTIANTALVLFGAWLIPSALKNGILGLAACLVLLVTYAVAVRVMARRSDGGSLAIIRFALLSGFIAGIIFTSEIMAEYILLPDAALNTTMGYFEFGSVFLIYLLAGCNSYLRLQQFKAALLTAVWAAMVASLIWLAVVLLVFYLFHGTDRQSLVLKAEGDYEDFKRSGMTDYNAFLMQDFWGAGFFHLLLGPVIATLLGTFGGLIGIIVSRVFLRPRRIPVKL